MAQFPNEHLSFIHALMGENKETWTQAVEKDMDSPHKNNTRIFDPRKNASSNLTA